MKNKLTIFGFFIFSSFAWAGDTLVMPDATEKLKSGYQKNELVAGDYMESSFLDTLWISAALVGNSSKIQSVNVAELYSPSDVKLNTVAAYTIASGIYSGEIGVATLDDNGSFKVEFINPAAFDKYLKQSCQVVAKEAVQSKEMTSCKTAMQDFFTQDGPNSHGKFIAANGWTKTLGEPKHKIIRWTPN